MLTIAGDGSARTCDGVTRRDFLQAGALGAFGLSLSDLAAMEARGGKRAGTDDRSVILIFNLGAPSQLDTFDMKPEAPREIRGPFRPIRTRGDFQISEILPLHARVADRFSLVRSCHHAGPAVHDAGHQLMQTGRLFADGVATPHAGCVLSYLRGRRRGLPAHVVLPEPMGRTGGNMPHGQEAGFLGKDHEPFVFQCESSVPEGAAPRSAGIAGIGAARIDNRRTLRAAVDDVVRDFEASDDPRCRDADFAAAARRLTGAPALEAFDLAREPRSVRDRYGMSRFGQSCLLARRLVEAGVRFVTVNTFVTVFEEITWDVHGMAPFPSIEAMRDVVAPMYDRAYSALIGDLDQRGLLDSTLVCTLAEFGRTPRGNPAGGRDHWPQCWTVGFAGGGVQGGRAIGQSDATGAAPADRPVEPAEIVATIFHSLGLDLATELPGPESRPMPLVDAGVREIRELF